MKRILIVVHPSRTEAHELGARLADAAIARGDRAHLPPIDAKRVGRPELALEAADVDGGLDLAISIGGDGTMLYTVNLVEAHKVPVLGVYAGRLGYLTEVQPEDAEDSVQRFFDGQGHIEERMQLAIEVHRPGHPVARHHALNEASVEKPAAGHMTRIRVDIDGFHFTTYHADGVIVATPTGSTAYSLSARGPVVAPGHRAQLVTPVAPHMMFDRTLVLEPETDVALTVVQDRGARLFVDGRDTAHLAEGDSIRTQAAECPARFVTFAPRNFHAILRAKFRLEEQ